MRITVPPVVLGVAFITEPRVVQTILRRLAAKPGAELSTVAASQGHTLPRFVSQDIAFHVIDHGSATCIQAQDEKGDSQP